MAWGKGILSRSIMKKQKEPRNDYGLGFPLGPWPFSLGHALQGASPNRTTSTLVLNRIKSDPTLMPLS